MVQIRYTGAGVLWVHPRRSVAEVSIVDTPVRFEESEMKKYRMDVEVVGYVTLIVEADTVDEACRAAARKALAMHMDDLSYKTTECTQLSEEDAE
jgi:hypothetical protein